MLTPRNQTRSGRIKESPEKPKDLESQPQRDHRSGAVKERVPLRSTISAPKSDLRIEVVNGRLKVVRTEK